MDKAPAPDAVEFSEGTDIAYMLLRLRAILLSLTCLT
jgi:hypothetical protein